MNLGDLKKMVALTCNAYHSVIVAGLRSMMCLLLAVVTLSLGGCKDDDMDVVGETVSASKTVEEINQNTKALQKLLAAQVEGKVLTNCTKLSASTYNLELEDGNSFSVLTSITPLGTAEMDVYSPIIGVKKVEIHIIGHWIMIFLFFLIRSRKSWMEMYR